MQVHTYGNHPSMHTSPETLRRTIATAVAIGAKRNKVCVLVPASNHTAGHFQLIKPAVATTSLEDRLWADGAYTYDVGSAIALPTADCQSIIIKNMVTKKMVVVHGGKPAMTPGHVFENTWINIMDMALHKAIKGADPANLQIYVTGVIAPQDYRHDDENGQNHIRPFLEVYGWEAFAGKVQHGCLDLFAVTKMIAQRHKVPADQITHDGIYTSRHPGLASYRTDKTANRNIIIAVNCHDEK